MIRLLPFVLCFGLGFVLGIMIVMRRRVDQRLKNDWEAKYRSLERRYRDLTHRLKDLDPKEDRANLRRRHYGPGGSE